MFLSLAGDSRLTVITVPVVCGAALLLVLILLLVYKRKKCLHRLKQPETHSHTHIKNPQQLCLYLVVRPFIYHHRTLCSRGRILQKVGNFYPWSAEHSRLHHFSSGYTVSICDSRLVVFWYAEESCGQIEQWQGVGPAMTTISNDITTGNGDYKLMLGYHHSWLC